MRKQKTSKKTEVKKTKIEKKEEKITEVKSKRYFPFIEGLTFPMLVINAHFKDFFKLITFAAFITSFFTIFMGRSNFCGMVHGQFSSVYCPFSSLAGIFIPISFLMVLFFSGFVYNRWQIIFSENKDFSTAIKQKDLKKDFKTSVYLFIYLLFWFGVGACLLIFEKRVPNPDWHKELLFFVLVSLTLLFFVFILFNFVIFQHSLSGGSIFSLHKTFWPIFDNLYKLIFWFFIYFFIFIYTMKISLMVYADKALPLWLNIIFGEVFFYFVIYSTVAFFSGMMFYQEKVLFDERE